MTPEQEDAAVTREEHAALKWTALAAALAIAWLVRPIGVGILLGMLLAFITQPFYERITPTLGVARSAFVVVLASTLAVAAAVFALAWLLVTKTVDLADELIAMVGPGGTTEKTLQWIGGRTARIGISPDALTAHARSLAGQMATGAASIARSIAGALWYSVLGTFFATLTMHFVLRNWETVARRAQEMLPLRPDYTRGLFAELRRVGRTTLMGTIGTGAAQGLLAMVGYWIAGVPQPVFFGAATAVASLVPVVGTTLLWAPIGAMLIVRGHPIAGIFELAWGALLIVGLSDYVIRPRLVGAESEVPSVVTLAAIFGGLEVFGLKGLLIGPVLMSLAVAVLRLYESETRLRRHLTSPGDQDAAKRELERR